MATNQTQNIFNGSEEENGGVSFLTGSKVNLPTNMKKRNTSRAKGHRAVMSYPVTQGPKEVTGDRLLIKCFSYKPPKTSIKFGKNVLGEEKKGEDGSTIFKETLDAEGRVQLRKGPPIGIDSQGGAGDRQKPNFYITLPIPQEINDSNAITWGDDSMNIFQLAGLTLAQGLTNNLGKVKTDDGSRDIGFGEAVSTISSSALTALGNIEPSTVNALTNAIAGKAINAIGGNLSVNSVIARTEGMALNNNLELLFNGVTLRSFPFNVTFTPRSQKEAQMVLEIIRALKSAMAAKRNTEQGQGGIFLRAPDVFSLRYLHNGKDHPFLNRIKDCALTSMNVNYTGAGTYASYFDGTPVSINLSMTFKELNPVYHEDYDDSIGGVGF